MRDITVSLMENAVIVSLASYRNFIKENGIYEETGMNWNNLFRIPVTCIEPLCKYFETFGIRHEVSGPFEGLSNFSVFKAMLCNFVPGAQEIQDKYGVYMGVMNPDIMGHIERDKFLAEIQDAFNSHKRTGVGEDWTKQVQKVISEVKTREDIQYFSIRYHSGAFSYCWSGTHEDFDTIPTTNEFGAGNDTNAAPKSN